MSSSDYFAISSNSSQEVKSITEDNEIENEVTAKIHKLKISSYKGQIFDDGVWFEILKFLPISSLPTVSLISKQIATVHNHKALWHIYAKSLNLKITTSNPKEELKDYYLYKKNNPLFAALEEILPYPIFKQIPVVNDFIPEKYLTEDRWYNDSEGDMWREFRRKIESFPMYVRLTDLYRTIYFNITTPESKNRQVDDKTYVLRYHIKNPKFQWIQDMSYIYTTTESRPHKAIVAYLGKLLRGEHSGELSSKCCKDTYEIVESDEQTTNGKSSIVLFPKKEFKELQKKHVEIKIQLTEKKINHYKSCINNRKKKLAQTYDPVVAKEKLLDIQEYENKLEATSADLLNLQESLKQ